LVVYLVVQSVLVGIQHFTVGHLLEAAPLRTVYAELREQQAAHLEERASRRDEFSAEKPVIQLADFEAQVADDLSILDSTLLELDSDSQDVVLRTDEVRALTAVAADAVARYEHDEQHLVAYMFSLMSVHD